MSQVGGQEKSDSLLQSQWTGMRFPFHFDVRTGKVAVSSTGPNNIDHIIESIYQILGTSSADPNTRKGGERVMLPEFGARLRSLVFENADDSLVQLAEHEAYKALKFWEPRIRTLRIQATIENRDSFPMLVLNINFEVNATRQIGEVLANLPIRS